MLVKKYIIINMIAEIIVDVSNSQVDKIFDYIIPEGLNVLPGYKVVVPFGGRQIDGFVIGIKESSEIESDKLKSILKCRFDFQIITDELLKDKFYLKMIDCIKLCIPTVIRSGKIKHNDTVFLSLNYEKLENYIKTIRANARKQLEIITYLKNTEKCELTKLAKNFSYTSVNKLTEADILIKSTERNLWRWRLWYHGLKSQWHLFYHF